MESTQASRSALNNTNITTIEVLIGGWGLRAGLAIAILVISTSSNLAALLYFFFKKRPAPFLIYVYFLLCSNLGLVVPLHSLAVLEEVGGQWQSGYIACGVYQYAKWVISGVSSNAHVLITINRLWALYFPLSYRNRHSRTVAILLCCFMVGFIHTTCLPVVVEDVMYYRPRDSHQCRLNIPAQRGAFSAMFFISSALPYAVMLGAYPFLLYENKKRERLFSASESKEGSTGSPEARRENPVTSRRGKAWKKFSTKSSKPINAVKKSGSFHILTCLTTSIFLTWTPAVAYYSYESFDTMQAIPYYHYAVWMVYDTQPTLDAILFFFCLRKLPAK